MLKKFGCFMMIICATLMYGCGQMSINDYAKSHISQINYEYYVGEVQDFWLTVTTGKRERDFAQDGQNSTLVDYCILSVVPKNAQEYISLQYTVEIGESKYQGELEKSPFDNTFGKDLGISFDKNATMYVTILVDDKTQICKMKNISIDFEIDCEKAFGLGVSALQEDLLRMSNNMQESVDAYCKIISTDKKLDIYYWLISFVNQSGEQVAVIIDTNSGQVITKM